MAAETKTDFTSFFLKIPGFKKLPNKIEELSLFQSEDGSIGFCTDDGAIKPRTTIQRNNVRVTYDWWTGVCTDPGVDWCNKADLL